MPQNAKYYGNVCGVPTGSPDDPIFSGEYFPDGQSAQGYTRRGLPSEMALDRVISPVRADREDGYLPSPPMKFEEIAFDHVPTEAEMRDRRMRRQREEREYLAEKENSDRRVQRSMRITTGNATGTFTGPPDRVR
jgi:hypothetical protein